MLKRIKKFFNLEKEENTGSSTIDKIDSMFDDLYEDTIRIKIGEDLGKFESTFCNVIGELREEIKDECGFIIPGVRINDDETLQENEFRISVHGKMTENRFAIPTEEEIKNELYDALKSSIYDNLDSIFTNDIAEKYINAVQKNNGWLIWNITNVLSVVQIKTILTDIISHGKSINNINYIFEKIGEQILSSSEYKDCLKQYNPHTISNNIVKNLK